MIRLGAALELEWENAGACMETLSIGAGPEGSGYAMEIAGAWLSAIRSPFIARRFVLSASLLDSVGQPELLLKTEDNEAGWELCFRFICSLEKYRVQSLARPIAVGNPVWDPPAECWVIA